MTNTKAILFILGGVLAIFGGEVAKQTLTNWAQVMTLPFIAGLCVQLGGLLVAIGGGINYVRANGRSADLISEQTRQRIG